MTRTQEEDLERSVQHAEADYDKAKAVFTKQKQELYDLETGIQNISSKVNKALPNFSVHMVNGKFKRRTTVSTSDSLGTLEDTRIKLKHLQKEIQEEVEP